MKNRFLIIKKFAIFVIILPLLSNCKRMSLSKKDNNPAPTHHNGIIANQKGMCAQLHPKPSPPKNVPLYETPDILEVTTVKQKQPEIPNLLIKEESTREQRLTPREGELDFKLENKTGKTFYAACFCYIRKRQLSRWRWAKSPIYSLKNGEIITVDLPTVEDEYDRKNVFGTLGVFNNEQEAEDSIYELLPDDNKIELDQISKLTGQKVVIEVEKYGFKEPILDYDFVKIDNNKEAPPELDFLVRNSTGKTLNICAFVYQTKAKGTWIAAIDEKDDMSLWRYDKTNVITIKPDQVAYIDVDTIFANRDRSFVFGSLAIFDENEKKDADDATYELLESYRKINLGNLTKIKEKTVNLEIERYGVQGDIIDYRVQPTRRVDFNKHIP